MSASGGPAQPAIIQGGMGVGVSGWRLARAVARLGHLGVVSGTALDTVLVRRLQDGDPGGHLRRAMAVFPLPQVAEEALRRHFQPAGRPAGAPYRLLPMDQVPGSPERARLTMLAAFVEVRLAKDGHAGQVGLNLLTKVQLPNLALLYGAMLAGVDVVLMGAGIPRDVPAALDALAAHEPAVLRCEVEGLPPGLAPALRLDPREHAAVAPPGLHRPRFLAIVSSHSLATLLARKSVGREDGFVVEGHTAGGHNAPPRGEGAPVAGWAPVYGARDRADLRRIRELGLPFWIAGGMGRPGGLAEARRAGAAGIQVGTLFATCDESGLAEPLKRSLLEHAARGAVDVRTDPVASPTGYPFKVVRWEGDPAAGVTRARVCDLGYLRVAYRMPAGRIGYRCPSEPVEAFVAKGGRREVTEGRLCLCNGLMASIGLGQVRPDGTREPPLVTSGDDLASLATFLGGRTRYSAADVVAYLAGSAAAPPAGA